MCYTKGTKKREENKKMFDDYDVTITCEEVYDEHWNEGFTDEEWKEIMEG